MKSHITADNPVSVLLKFVQTPASVVFRHILPEVQQKALEMGLTICEEVRKAGATPPTPPARGCRLPPEHEPLCRRKINTVPRLPRNSVSNCKDSSLLRGVFKQL